jgi:hypothetical protein
MASSSSFHLFFFNFNFCFADRFKTPFFEVSLKDVQKVKMVHLKFQGNSGCHHLSIKVLGFEYF